MMRNEKLEVRSEKLKGRKTLQVACQGLPLSPGYLHVNLGKAMDLHG
jgi:hypothetical protein